MPTYVSWEPRLSICVEDIDNRQQELLKRLNDFFTAVVGGDGKEEVNDLLDFLVDYCVVHFGSEELHMQSSQYPEYSSHKTAHEQFAHDILEVQRKIQQDANSHDVINLVDLLGCWVAEHIGKMDAAFAMYLRSGHIPDKPPLISGTFKSDTAPIVDDQKARNGGTCRHISECTIMFSKFQDPESQVFWRNRYCMSRQYEHCERKKMIEMKKSAAEVPLTLLPNGEHLLSLAY